MPKLGSAPYLEVLGFREGHGDSVNRFIMGIIGVSTWLIGLIDLLTPSRPQASLHGLPCQGPPQVRGRITDN